MKRIGSFNRAPISTAPAPIFEAAPKQSVPGTPLEAPQGQSCPYEPITTPEAVRALFPELTAPNAELFLGIAKAFGVDPADHAGLLALDDLAKRSQDFRDELNRRRDKNGFAPLHNAVMQGDNDLMIFFLGAGADPAEQVSAIAYHDIDARSIGIRNQQLTLKKNPHVGRNALTLAIACHEVQLILKLINYQFFNGQKLVNIPDARGDSAVCVAVEHLSGCLGILLEHHPEAGRLANGAGVKPIELAIKSGQVETFEHLVFHTYMASLDPFAPETGKAPAREELAKATRLFASSWTGLPSPIRNGILACILGKHRYNVAPGHTVKVYPFKRCINVLFEEGLKLVGSGADSYDSERPLKTGERDYTLIWRLLSKGGHKLLQDQGISVRAFAKEQQNDYLLVLCNSGAVPHEVGPREVVSIETDSDADA
jgi:hypothetical protein